MCTGRIFDLLVQKGVVYAEHLTGLVDIGLYSLVKATHGLPIFNPDAIIDIKPDVVAVASRSLQQEIVSQLQGVMPDCEILSLSDLLISTDHQGEHIGMKRPQ